jgi:hypothetical protein
MRFNQYDTSVQYHEHELEDALLGDFLRRYPEDEHAMTDQEEYVIESITAIDFAKAVAKIMGPYSVITGYSSTQIAIENTATPQLVVIWNNEHSDTRSTQAFRTSVIVRSTGPEANIKSLFKQLDDQFPHHDHTVIQWWYKAKGGLEHMSMVLDHNENVYDEFYPWMNGGYAKYFDDFINSKAPLLFISGPPGTGKTSFIRKSITRHNMNAYVAYDPDILNRDDMFLAFLSSKRDHVMVLEDSESVVLPRDKTGSSSIMSRFLNVSDGLLKNNRKKFIFTTNDDNFERIDEALIRPGRCYDFNRFRRLDYSEAVSATNVAGLPQPTDTRKDYSLAELFNQSTKAPPVFKVGFNV